MSCLALSYSHTICLVLIGNDIDNITTTPSKTIVPVVHPKEVDVEWTKYCEDDDPFFIRMNVRNIKTLQPFQLYDPVRVAPRTKSGDNKIGGDGTVSKINHGIVLHMYKILSPPPMENCHSFLIFVYYRRHSIFSAVCELCRGKWDRTRLHDVASFWRVYNEETKIE